MSVKIVSVRGPRILALAVAVMAAEASAQVIDDARGRGLEVFLETNYGNPVYPGGGGRGLSGGFPTSDEALTAWDNWVEAMATRYRGKCAIGKCGT